jgi:hypothetical protein
MIRQITYLDDQSIGLTQCDYVIFGKREALLEPDVI